jgi:hypothetical protein
MATERVYAVWDYYDGILTGVADYGGVPHYFQRDWNPKESDELPIFELTPIEPAMFELVQEQWQIFRTWELAAAYGEVSHDTHPGLPGQHERYAELEEVLQVVRASKGNGAIHARADFQPVPEQGLLPRGVMPELLVEWQRVA